MLDRRQTIALMLSLAVPPVLHAPRARAEDAGPATLIRNATIVDGTGQPAAFGAVRFNRRILAIGDIRPTPGDIEIDAAGLTLVPGFIDTHTHHIDTVVRPEKPYLFDRPEALAAVSQGITTSLVGQDGRSMLPLARGFRRIERTGSAINVASFVGHGAVREAVMKEDFRRNATPAEIRRMQALVATAMAEGALGLSTGLEYNPGVYSTPEEVLALAQVAARHGGRYISHIRSEDRELWAAVEETIAIGKATGMPVQLTHMKLGMVDLWGRADALIARLNRARADGVDITADVYPYDFWQTSLSLLFPDRDYKNRAAAEYALRHVVKPEGIRFTLYKPNPAYVGRTLAEIARERGEDPATTLMALIVDAPVPDDFEYATMQGMNQDDVDRLFLWEHSNLCSDGFLIDGHPRGAGAFTRALRHYVRDRKLLDLPQAIHKMTALAAAHMGLRGRGRIARDDAADLVLLDPQSVTDTATADNPLSLSKGIAKVWVNGGLVFAEGRATGARPGVVLRRA